MSTAQIVVLVLIAAAFAAGWFAAERPTRGSEGGLTRELCDLLGECEHALGGALAALATPVGAGSGARSLSARDPEALGAVLAELGPLGDRLRSRVGSMNPLAIEFEQACSACSWLGRDLERGWSAADHRTREVERAARDAATRFRRVAHAIRMASEEPTE